ncbi:MAG TPA: hypothetical protein VEG38_07520 [Acidimicrobiia bacterium]|nr:hypothetical protein [Acidimicrobiia bacterium]
MKPGTVLWRVLDVQASVALAGIGGLIALAGWWGTSQSATVADQVPWTALAVAGLLTAQLGTVWLILAGRLALRRRHGGLARRLSACAGAAGASGPERSAVVVAAAAMTRYHRPDCAAVAGKAVEEASVEAQRRAGRRPCGLCTPSS